MIDAGQKIFVAMRGIFYAICFIVLWAWVAVIVEPFDERLGIGIPAFARFVGWPVAVAGAVLTLWCVAEFILRGRGTPAPFDAPRNFVSQGPYRFVRNPMYVGALSVILGAGLILASPAIILLSAGFGVLTHMFVFAYEKPASQQKFGDNYRRYRGNVNRWLPGSGRTGTSRR
jgi:protein-S-isoprenylcysteine O-methyltransferase Ste14